MDTEGKKHSVVLAAGGTGGHVFPAIAVAQRLEARGISPLMLVDARGERFVRGGNLAYRVVPSGGLVGLSLWGKMKGLIAMARGYGMARSLLRRHGAELVVGFGGYPAVAPILAARRLGLPTFLHEQNAIMGRANRILAKRVDSLLLSFAETVGAETVENAQVIGNPVRASIAELDAPVQRDDGGLVVLVLGGSQGAHVFAEAIPAALNLMEEKERKRLHLLIQARLEDEDAVRAALPALAAEPDVRPFFTPIADFLAAADLVVARAGATTCAELAAAGRPAIFVPLNSPDQHQHHNARAMVEAGAAWLVEQDADLPETLAKNLHQVLDQPDLLAKAAQATRNLHTGRAADLLADLIEEKL